MGTSGEADSGDLWKMESLLSAGPHSAALKAPERGAGRPLGPQ